MMDITINKKTNRAEFNLGEKDLNDARMIKEMMNTEGWRILKDYITVGRESILDRLKERPTSDTEVRKTALVGQMLHGWDECKALPERIVARAEEFMKAQEEEEEKEREELLNDGRHEG